MKVMTILGTRPEIIKLSRVIGELEANTKHILVHTGQNYDYELNEIFFLDLGIRKPDYFLNSVSTSPAETIGKIIAEIDKILELEKPDAVLIYGDTNSCLSVISAKRRKIPIFHMEAGNRCFDLRVPEEINRKIVDHTSDINMTLTEHARRYLIMEGIRPETIFKIGSSMKEVYTHYEDKIADSKIIEKMNLIKNEYFVVSAHKEENIDNEENFNDLVDTLNYIASRFNIPLIVSTHPRTKKKIITNKINFLENVVIMKPLGFFDYVNLQKHAKCVISDSGTIFEESSLLKFPAVTIRKAHERPEGMDVGTLIMTGLKKEEVENAINITVRESQEGYHPGIISDFNVDDVSRKVLKIILSYTNYVKRTVWKEDR